MTNQERLNILIDDLLKCKTREEISTTLKNNAVSFTRRKLTVKQITEIRVAYERGTPISALATMYRVNQETIENVLKRKGAYKDIA